MLRLTRLARDQTRQPMKSFKYGYQPDPRKIAPRRSISRRELFPKVVRPPSREVPDVAAFLTAADNNKYNPVGEHAGSFESWHELFHATTKQMKDKGIPIRAIKTIVTQRDIYNNGDAMDKFNATGMQEYYGQFPHKGYTYKIPDLPDRYRPHQLGEEQRSTPDVGRLAVMPEWAVAEEARLAEKRGAVQQ
jgi:hypothetical protein